jgi:hypothetical protein
LSATYLGEKILDVGPNPFEVQERDISVDQDQQLYEGMPVFSATITGIDSSLKPYFYADFNAMETIVWASNCTQIVYDNETSIPISCSEAPTYMQTAFTENEQTTWIGEYHGFLCNGIVSSGNKYAVEACMGNTCKVITVYAADFISQDTLLYGQDASFGILNFGLTSPFWYSLIDPETNKATYSISIGRPSTQQAMLASDSTP